MIRGLSRLFGALLLAVLIAAAAACSPAAETSPVAMDAKTPRAAESPAADGNSSLSEMQSPSRAPAEPAKGFLWKIEGGARPAYLTERNSAMADKIDDCLREGEDGTYLIAVGSLHMVGENGLVSLLQRKGYEVEFVI